MPCRAGSTPLLLSSCAATAPVRRFPSRLLSLTHVRMNRHANARAARRIASLAPALALALLAACGTVPKSPDVSRLPPGTSQRDGPEANPPSNLESVPDATPQIEQRRAGGPNKPYEVDGHTYVPLTDDRPVTEKGLASWYGKKFHGRRTASGEAYNMYAMTAAHKTLPIPSYARVRNPANGREVIVRVNDRGPFAAGRVIDLSYTAALKLGVLGGVQQVEVERITDDDIRTGAAFKRSSTQLASAAPVPPPAKSRAPAPAGTKANAVAVAPPIPAAVPDAVPSSGAVTAALSQPLPAVAAATAQGDASAPNAPASTIAETPGASATVVAATDTASRPVLREEQGHAETAAAAGFWVQIGAYRQREGALDFQHRLIDEQPWLAPLLAVFTDHGMNRLQAGPYSTRDDARDAAERIRVALQLVPTIVEKR
jgi:rare lipoprotein A